MIPRRFYLLQRIFCPYVEQRGVWRAKQEAEPGTPLPATFPALAALSAVGYTTAEDVRGADELELRKAGLSINDARAVVAAALTI